MHRERASRCMASPGRRGNAAEPAPADRGCGGHAGPEATPMHLIPGPAEPPRSPLAANGRQDRMHREKGAAGRTVPAMVMRNGGNTPCTCAPLPETVRAAAAAEACVTTHAARRQNPMHREPAVRVPAPAGATAPLGRSAPAATAASMPVPRQHPMPLAAGDARTRSRALAANQRQDPIHRDSAGLHPPHDPVSSRDRCLTGRAMRPPDSIETPMRPGRQSGGAAATSRRCRHTATRRWQEAMRRDGHAGRLARRTCAAGGKARKRERKKRKDAQMNANVRGDRISANQPARPSVMARGPAWRPSAHSCSSASVCVFCVPSFLRCRQHRWPSQAPQDAAAARTQCTLTRTSGAAALHPRPRRLWSPVRGSGASPPLPAPVRSRAACSARTPAWCRNTAPAAARCHP